jgi:hypothetical protein
MKSVWPIWVGLDTLRHGNRPLDPFTAKPPIKKLLPSVAGKDDPRRYHLDAPQSAWR